MSTVETILSETIPQQLVGRATFTVQELSPFLAKVTSNRSSLPVRKLHVQAANDWVFQKNLGLGMGGSLRSVPTTGPSISSAAQPQIVLTEAQTYPAPLEATIPGYDTMTGRLSQLRGNIVMDESILMQNQAEGMTADVFKDTMEGVSLRIALNKISKFYTPASATRHICTVSSVSIDSGSNTANFVPTEGNEVMFHEGHMLNFFDSTGATNKAFTAGSASSNDDTSTMLMVTAVDPINRRVYVADLSQTGALSAIANGDLVTHQGEYIPSVGQGYGAYGLVDWLVNAGTVLGIDTATFQRIKSIVTTNLAGPWTEDEADKHLMWYNRWHRRFPITDIFFTPGALLAHKKTMLGIFQADRTGKPVKIVGGHTALEHVHDGKTILYHSDVYQRSGASGSVATGVYMGSGNFTELVPPNAPGDRTGAGFGSEVRFKVNSGGPGQMSIFQMVGFVSGGAATVQSSTLREAPFSMWYNIWPMMHLPGLLVGGITESNLV